ncbi:hypothetical protein SN15_14590 [Stenotrophomonas maltophilia]|nr:hypothetical protein SN15_14590 [Stenotrophomonas maltophilia]
MIGSILQFQDLQELCKPGAKPRLATVEQWARDCRIKFEYDGNGGIWTTVTALNDALGLRNSSGQADLYDPAELL